MSEAAAVVEKPVKAVQQTASGLVGLVQKHPGGALVVFGILMLVIIRYRNGIVGLFSKVPVVGTRAAGFAVGPTSTTTSTGA